MGSDSDWPVMEAAVTALDELGVACEVDVVSAHRMPEEMLEYGRSAEERGLRVLVAGAGGAAHLPGMLASVTSLPVIGVPVPLTHLDGLDSLLSIVQMPAGVPVATVSVGGARNAGLLAARILGAGEGAEAERLRAAMARVPARRCATRRTPRAPPCASAAAADRALAARVGQRDPACEPVSRRHVGVTPKGRVGVAVSAACRRGGPWATRSSGRCP